MAMRRPSGEIAGAPVAMEELFVFAGHDRFVNVARFLMGALRRYPPANARAASNNAATIQPRRSRHTRSLCNLPDSLESRLNRRTATCSIGNACSQPVSLE